MEGETGPGDNGKIVREVKRLYFETTPETLDEDFARALELSARVPEDSRDHHRLERYLRAFPRLRHKLDGAGGEEASGPEE